MLPCAQYSHDLVLKSTVSCMNLHMRRFPPEASSSVVFLTVDRSACCSVRPSLPIFVPEPEASVRALRALPLTPAKFPPEHVRPPQGRWVQLRVTFSDATCLVAALAPRAVQGVPGQVLPSSQSTRTYLRPPPAWWVKFGQLGSHFHDQV